MVEISWTPQSIEDIENIADYISNDSLKYAKIQVKNFFEAVIILEKHPKAGRMVPELKKANIRELIVGLYRLIYHIKNSEKIEILTVHHSRRLLKVKVLRKRI